MEHHLLPCLCGATRFDVHTMTMLTGMRCAIVCLECLAVGPWKRDQLHAELAWNADKMAITAAQKE